MKTLVIYDSAYGNTAKVAHAIYDAARNFGETRTVVADKFQSEDVDDVDMIFIGTPTQGGRPTTPIQNLVKTLSADKLKNVHIAPFDTRFAKNTHGVGLKIVMNVIGFAAPKIARALRRMKVGIVEDAEGFIVKDSKGPLERDELVRASLWAKTVIARVK